MKNTNRNTAVTAAAIMCAMLSACGNTSQINEAAQKAQNTSDSCIYTGSGTEIMLSDDEITVEGGGASAENGIITITAAGEYILSGELSAGQIRVNAPDEAKVKLILNGVTVISPDSAAVYVENADKTAIILAEGSENCFEDGAIYSVTDESGEPDACIFSKDDLEIEGAGRLTVTGNSNHGIHGKDDVRISGGIISVTSANDGIKGKDSVDISGGEITVVSAGDGICSNNSDDAEKGAVNISGGVISVISGGGRANARMKEDSFFNFRDSSGDEGNNAVSCKGIKAAQAMNISGGSFVLDCCDDAFHSDGFLNISGGEFEIVTGDDGMHADAQLMISGGNCVISECYEGLEGVSVDISGGSWNINAADDGINAAGGSDEISGNRKQDIFAVNENNQIFINGGIINIDAGADGVDSNGMFTVNGGDINICGAENGGNGAIDSNGSITVNGGALIAAGYSDMAQTPSAESSIGTLAITFTEVQQGGTSVKITDSQGNEIISAAPEKSFSSLVISHEALVSGCTVTLHMNDSQMCNVTLSNAVTMINEKGEYATGGQLIPGGSIGSGGRHNGRKPFGEADGDISMPQMPEGMPARPDMIPPEGFNGNIPQMPETAQES